MYILLAEQFKYIRIRSSKNVIIEDET